MTRIAVQFFGHLRTFEKCFPSLRRYLLNHYDCDIFMHTWDTYNHNTKTWHNNSRGKNKPVNKAKIMKILGINDDQIIVEHQGIFDTGHFYADGVEFDLQGLKSVYHSMKSVNKLREQYQKKYNIEYDCVVCVRPDIMLMKNLDLKKYIAQSDYENTVYFGGIITKDIHELNGAGACDLLFFGAQKTMSKLCNNLKPLVKNGQTLNHLPEGLLIDNATKNNINCVLLGTYLCNDAFEIERPKQIKMSNLISLPIDKNGIKLKILAILPHIISFKIKIFNYDLGFFIGGE